MREHLIGVLDLQGDVKEHLRAILGAGGTGVRVKTVEELLSVDALIIPGGESTTVGKLLDRFGLMETVRSFSYENKPIYGTCTGMILLAKEIEGSEQHRLGLMDIVVKRNAYGRQIDSFEADLDIAGITTKEEPHHSIFIRAPYVTSVHKDVKVMSEIEGNIVMVRQGSLLASSFHPELTEDYRIHKYFLDMVEEYRR